MQAEVLKSACHFSGNDNLSVRNQRGLKVCEGCSIRETSSMPYVRINPEYAFLGSEYDVTSSGHRLSVIASPPGFCWCLTTEYYDTARTT